MQLQKQTFYLTGLATLLISAFIVATAPSLLAEAGILAGYGYGYGEEEVESCSASAPTRLKAVKTPKQKTIVKLKWKKVEFSTCDNAKPKKYIVKIYKKNHLVKQYRNVRNRHHQFVKKGVLKPLKQYKFKVRAVAVDGTKTGWSNLKRFTTPAH